MVQSLLLNRVFTCFTALNSNKESEYYKLITKIIINTYGFIYPF